MKFLTDTETRSSCGVARTNEFVFAMPGGTAISISDAVNTASKNADLQYPERVGCTMYRKYMATVVQVQYVYLSKMCKRYHQGFQRSGNL